MTMAELRAYRKIPAKRGMRVTVDGKPGRIVGNGRRDRIVVRFDAWPKLSKSCHPIWEVVYHTEDGDVSPWKDRQAKTAKASEPTP